MKILSVNVGLPRLGKRRFNATRNRAEALPDSWREYFLKRIHREHQDE